MTRRWPSPAGSPRETSLVPIAHLTCVGHTRDELEGSSTPTSREGVFHVMALRGDPHEGPRAEWTPTEGGLNYALDARRAGPRRAATSASASPRSRRGTRAPSRSTSTPTVLVAKANAGAEFAVTQMFFRAADYFGLVDRVRARGVDIPILPGHHADPEPQRDPSPGRADRHRRCPRRSSRGSAPPAPSPAAIRAEGIKLAAELCEELLDGGAPGPALLHAEPVEGDARDLRSLNITV